MAVRKLCYGCMMNTDYHNGTCQRCGYNENVPVNAAFIQPGTELGERYIVGTALSMNGEGITYIALDRSVGCRVQIREYMPMNMCSCAENAAFIRVNPSKLPQYKVLLEEFMDLSRTLAHLRDQVQISTVTDLFTENNTAYVVYEHIDGMRFVDFLKENAGELSWGQLSGMLPSFLTSLGILHNNGLIHRAISPETIYVTRRGELKLTDFSISAVRTADSELDCEIFSGYAAPEQYSASNRQGTWTDVYAVCAVLYRVLTGSMPTSAISRMEQDNLLAPNLLNPNISSHVSDVIMSGLNLVSADRIQNITELVTKLFSEQPTYQNQNVAPGGMAYGQNGGYPQQDFYEEPMGYQNGFGQPQEYSDDYSYDGGYDSYQRESYKEEPAGAIDRIKAPLIIGMLLLVILLICVYFMFARGGGNKPQTSGVMTTTETVTTTVTETEPATEATTPEGDSIMPKLVGKNFNTQADRYSTWMKFKVEEVFSDEHAAGIIIWQEIEEGEYFDSSEPVKIQVSKGPSKILLPPYSGVYIGDYTKQLDELGVKYKIEPEITSACTANTVSKLSIDISEQFDLASEKELTVYYAVAPTTEATTTEAIATEAATTTAVQTEAPVVTEAPIHTEAPAPETTNNPLGFLDDLLSGGGMIW